MKNSNKLLVVFATALILLPLIGMIYVSRVDYTTETPNTADAKTIEHFSTPTKNMESIVVSSAFESVSIEDAKKMSIYIHFIKDDKYGVKISENLKDSITFDVEQNGQLQIRLKNKATNQRNSYYANIYIYSPNVKQLNVTNASALVLNARLDSLGLNVKNTNSVNLQQDFVANLLQAKMDEVKIFNVREIKLKVLELNLNSASFNSELNSFDRLSITAIGESDIEINGDDKKEYAIKNLALNTLGKANVKLLSVKVDLCTGSLSDETTVQMPAINLNQMFKAKK